MTHLTGRLGTTPRDQFAGEVLGRFQATAGLDQVWYDRPPYGLGVLRRRDPEPIWVQLCEAFEDFGSLEPANRAAMLTQYATAVGKLGTEMPWAQARHLVFPILKGATFGLRRPSPAAAVDRPGETVPIPLLRRPAFPHLDELVLLKLPVAPQLVSLARVARWGIEPDELFATARANLQGIAPDPRNQEPATQPKLLRLFAKGGVMASCLLLGGWLAYLALAVGGRPVAFPVDGDTLLVAPDDADLLGELYGDIGVQYQQSSSGLSPVGYTTGDDGVVGPLSVPDDHPLAAAVGRSENLLPDHESGAGGGWHDQADAQAAAEANAATTDVSTTTADAGHLDRPAVGDDGSAHDTGGDVSGDFGDVMLIDH